MSVWDSSTLTAETACGLHGRSLGLECVRACLSDTAWGCPLVPPEHLPTRLPHHVPTDGTSPEARADPTHSRPRRRSLWATPIGPAVGSRDHWAPQLRVRSVLCGGFGSWFSTLGLQSRSGLPACDPLWLLLPPQSALWPASNSPVPLDLRCCYLKELYPFEIEI